MLKKKISGASPFIFIFTVVMFLGVTFSGDDDIYEKINKISASQLLDIANRILVPGNLSRLIYQ